MANIATVRNFIRICVLGYYGQKWITKFITIKSLAHVLLKFKNVSFRKKTSSTIRNVYMFRSCDSSVGTATGYGLHCPGLTPSRARFVSSPQSPDRFWGPLSLLSNGQRGRFPWGQSGWGLKLPTYLHLVPRSRNVELYLHSITCPHDVVFN
jgi:hypothetical protein